MTYEMTYNPYIVKNQCVYNYVVIVSTHKRFSRTHIPVPFKSTIVGVLKCASLMLRV